MREAMFIVYRHDEQKPKNNLSDVHLDSRQNMMDSNI
jgi:hypothetical protein